MLNVADEGGEGSKELGDVGPQVRGRGGVHEGYSRDDRSRVKSRRKLRCQLTKERPDVKGVILSLRMDQLTRPLIYSVSTSTSRL